MDLDFKCFGYIKLDWLNTNLQVNVCVHDPDGPAVVKL